MRMVDMLKKAFIGGKWAVAYRKNNEEYHCIKLNPNEWYADPFVFETNEEHYIFVEQYICSKDKGSIGYFKIENGIPVNKGIIIDNPYHMSYPNIFEYHGKQYMIPESSANSTVDMYVAESFPDKWKHECTLIEGKKLVDSTVYKENDNYYLITYSMDKTYNVQVYRFDIEKKKVDFLSSKEYRQNVGRPAGRLFVKNGKSCRPAQDCSKKYGQEIIIYEIDALNNNGNLVEHEISRITYKDINVDKNFQRIHHITYDGTYEVVDLFSEKFDLFRVPKLLLRSMKK